MDLADFKEKLLKIAGTGKPKGSGEAAVDELLGAHEATIREIKRLELKFETVVEITSQINAKSLNIELIENFTLNTVMGYFACPQVFLMRRDNHKVDDVIPTSVKNMKQPGFSFKVADAFSKKLMGIGEPFGINEHKKILGKLEEMGILRKLGVHYLVPLVKQGEGLDRSLQGLICMGRKFKGNGFTPDQVEFLQLLGNMIAISLHNAQLYRRSIFDGLTQVYSRGHFDVHLSQEIERAKRYSRMKDIRELVKHVSLIMLDIDDFKNFNDSYGHQAGDAILKTLAQAINNNCRTSDVVARYGGEEFCIILPETNKENAIIAADRLMTSIGGTTTEWNSNELKVTVSMGVATFPNDCEDMTNLIYAADTALYKSKAEGKDRISIAPPLAGEGTA
jgi:diguanylate cyclase (GGDEF)-like protein